MPGARRLGVLSLALAGWAAVSAQAPPPSPFEACATSAAAPRTQVHTLCLLRVARQHDRLPEVRERLRHLGAGTSAHPWPTMVLGYATQDDDEERALRLYEVAADGFTTTGDAEGEVLARHNLRNLYHRRGRVAAAAEQVRLALATAERSGQPMPVARASVLEAAHIVEVGGDFGRAYRSLVRAQRQAFPDGPIGLRRTILIALANASLYLGQLDESIAALEAHRALRQVDGSTADAATVAYNLLNARLTRAEQRPRPGARARLTSEAVGVLAEATRLERAALVAHTHRVLADLSRTSDPSLAATHLRECLAIEARLGEPELRAGCLWSRSLLEARRHPARAERASRDAIDALKATPGSPHFIYAWQARLRLSWQTLQEDAAMPASLQALDAIERLRAMQTDATTRAALFSHWARDYDWLVGQLLQADTPRLPQAFEVGERRRTRALLDHLTRAGVREGSAQEAALQGRPTAQRQQIVEAQRRLLMTTWGGDEHRQLLAQLRALEIEEREAHSGDGVAVPAHAFASLAQVQRGLGETEALLWYSIAPWEDVYGDFGGGAWLVTVTRQAVRAHRLPVSGDLEGQVSAFVGLLRNRQTRAESWSPAAARLGATLLEPALADLPSGIDRLVIVPDGDLHVLPFETLTIGDGGLPLGEQFDITLVPSATLWLHLRARRDMAPRASALVLADPALATGVRPDAERLGPLPWARREAQSIARLLGLDAHHVREGADASEQFLKRASLAEVGVLHLAAHARADEAFPDRSAVFLTAGDRHEDGWLQPNEIAALSLEGRLVVLSACASAGGTVLAGEGPLSLARAFFAGGASTVVATRWPLRDDEAAFVMTRFYTALREGLGAAPALRRARREAIAHGLPADAWASFVVLGDGSRVPLSAAPSRWRRWRVAVIPVTAALAALVVVTIARVRRRSPRV